MVTVIFFLPLSLSGNHQLSGAASPHSPGPPTAGLHRAVARVNPLIVIWRQAGGNSGDGLPEVRLNGKDRDDLFLVASKAPEIGLVRPPQAG